MKKKLYLLIPMVLIAVFLLTGCNGDDAQGDGDVTLTFWHANTDPELIALYQSWEDITPGVTIEQTTFVDDDFKVQARVALAAGNTPDVWYMNTGMSLIQFVEEGGMRPIQEFRDEFGWDDIYDATSLNWTSIDGELYGLPWTQFTPWHIIWANSDFFAEHGLDYPVTVADYIALAPVLRELGQEPLTFYNLDGWYGAIFFGEFVAQMMDGGTWIDEINSGERRWDEDPVARRAFEYMVEMAEAGVFLTGFDTLRQDTALPVWAAQQSPLMYNGTWFTGVIGYEFDFSVQALTFPRIYEGSTTHSFQNALDWALGITPETEHIREALEFITFAAGPEHHYHMTASGFTTSPIPEINDRVELPYFFLQPPMTDQVGMPATDFFCFAWPMPVIAEVEMQISLLLTGQTDVDSALSAIQRVHNDHY